MVKHPKQSAFPKINTWDTSSSLILLTLSYVFNQKVKTKQKKTVFIHIYWKQGLQRATIKNTPVLQILSEYLVHEHQTHSL